MRVLAVDPGMATGMALYDDAVSSLPTLWVEPYVEGVANRVREELILGLDALVCEDFFISGPRAHDANLTIELIGVCRYLAWSLVPATPFFAQAPAIRKFSTDAKLRRMGWWVPASTDHARSASRHLLYYLASIGAIPASAMLDSPAEVGA